MKLWDFMMLKLKTSFESLKSDYEDHVSDGHPFGSNIPIGAIIMWYTTDYIPDGWFLCNGTYGTPDLQYKIPVCLSLAPELGNTFQISTGTNYTCILILFIMKRY